MSRWACLHRPERDVSQLRTATIGPAVPDAEQAWGIHILAAASSPWPQVTSVRPGLGLCSGSQTDRSREPQHTIASVVGTVKDRCPRHAHALGQVWAQPRADRPWAWGPPQGAVAQMPGLGRTCAPQSFAPIRGFTPCMTQALSPWHVWS